MKSLKLKNPTVKLVVGPSIVILIASLLFFYLVSFSYPQIQDKLGSLKEARNLENTLTERVELLKVFRDGVLDEKSDQIYLVLPDKNSSAILISQLRNDLLQQSLSLSGVDVVSETEENSIKKSSITYEFVSNDFLQPLKIALALKETAPVSTIEELKITKDVNNTITNELKTTIYWSNLPTNLPSLNMPIAKISTEEQQVLDRVLRYRFPSVNNPNPEINNNRRNPFN